MSPAAAGGAYGPVINDKIFDSKVVFGRARPTMKEIITIQHAESCQHLNGMVGGWTDWPLTDRGKRQAEAIGLGLARRLEPGADYALVSSDLLRAKQTAQLAGAPLGLTPLLRKELREINFGSATGKSAAWMTRHLLPREAHQSALQYRNLPDAESLWDVYLRLTPFAEELLASPRERWIIVSHCAALGMFFSKLLNLDLRQTPCTMFAGAAAGVSKLRIDEDGTVSLCYLNDCSDWQGRI